MASSYTAGQMSQALDGADPDSTFNVTRESNESSTQKKKRGKFFSNPFKKKSKAPDSSTDGGKGGITDQSTVGGDPDDQSNDFKRTANGLVV